MHVHSGILTILGVGIIATYTGYTIGQLKQRHSQIHTMADAGDILLGSLGRRTLGIAQLVFFIFVMGSHILTFSIMMNVLTDHSSCTILYAALGLLVSFVLTLPRRLEKLSHLSSVSFVSITGAVLTSMVGVSLAKLHSGPVPTFSPTPAVHDACLAIANVVFAYAGHVAFFTLFSELKDLRDFPKALALLQICEMILYTISAIVIYAYVGQDVRSPALNSAGKLFRKISYGIALPTVRVLLCETTYLTDFGPDCDWRGGKCPCCGEVHLCPHVSRHRLDAYPLCYGPCDVGCHLCYALDLVMDHCRRDTHLQ